MRNTHRYDLDCSLCRCNRRLYGLARCDSPDLAYSWFSLGCKRSYEINTKHPLFFDGGCYNFNIMEGKNGKQINREILVYSIIGSFFTSFNYLGYYWTVRNI